MYLKYQGARFFFNTEVDWFQRIRTMQPTLTGEVLGNTPIRDGSGSFFAPQYVDSWRWMVEAGYFAGPAKMSALYAFIPGPDRRHGILIDRQRDDRQRSYEREYDSDHHG